MDRNEFKKKVQEEFQIKLWGNEINQKIEREILREMEERKKGFEMKIKIEENFIAEMEKSHKYEDRQKKKKSEEIRDGLRKQLENQGRQIEICQKRIERLEMEETAYNRSLRLAKEF